MFKSFVAIAALGSMAVIDNAQSTASSPMATAEMLASVERLMVPTGTEVRLMVVDEVNSRSANVSASASASLHRVKTELDHLPQAKRHELAHVVEVIRASFAFALARRTQPRLRAGVLRKIILYGSHTRGDWVDDPVGRYFSDFDLLVVVSDDELTDVSEFWERTEKRLMTELSTGKVLRAPVSPIYHSLADVNDKLKLGRYFFIDIVRDGIVLFEEPGIRSPSPNRSVRAGRSRRRGTILKNGSRMRSTPARL